MYNCLKGRQFMVQNFIILGLIPGTHIQINFTDWLVLASVLSLLMMLWPLIRPLFIRIIARQQLTFIALALLIEDY
jgi:hypothetical protein